MNNHGIICKNNNMIIFLLFLVIIIFILLNQRVKFDVNFSILGVEYYFCVTVNYFFEIITLYKEDFMKYRKKAVKIKCEEWPLEYFKVEKILYETKVGLEDPFITSIIVSILSTISAILLHKYLPESSKQFKVQPVYNKFFFSTKGAILFSIKLKDLLYILFHIWFKRRKNNANKS